jgi:hypothetical protein
MLVTIRQEMLDSAARGGASLPEAHTVAASIRTRRAVDGGFAARDGAGDLYYTVFALQTLCALGALPDDDVAGYLDGFGAGESLDFVHLCCLIRCRAIAGVAPSDQEREAMLRRLAGFRSADGGFAPAPGASRGTAYAVFLAVGAIQDLSARLERPDELAGALSALATGDGGYANAADLPVASVPATAAAMTALRHLGEAVPKSRVAWLRAAQGANGAWGAVAASPSDLLSTAVALHALAPNGLQADHTTRCCRQFLCACRRTDGGFAATPDGNESDVEYTFYALLALGHLTGAVASAP